MNWKRIEVIIALMILLVSGVVAQRVTQLRINEVMVKNSNNYHDDYGMPSPWIEIFNSAYATVDIGGCYLSNDTSNLKKYLISKGDLRTKIKARQHLIFWADNISARGTFHLNFRLDSIGQNKLFLVAPDGVSIIDSVTIRWNGNAQTSIGRCTDGLSVIKNPTTRQMESAWKVLHIVTPGTNNQILTGKEYLKNLLDKFPDGIGNTVTSTGAINDKFKKNDSLGSGISFIAMFVVFVALILLFAMFKLLGNFSVLLNRRRLMRTLGIRNKADADVLAKNTGEIYAAIAMALYELDDEVHDWEETKLTMNKVAKTYSPWSSKIYGLRETPGKR
ncbi:MAG: OadG family transporter subunit [Bacteroidales bacterium]